MSDLKKAVIKLANQNPELRVHLLPALREAQEKEALLILPEVDTRNRTLCGERCMGMSGEFCKPYRKALIEVKMGPNAGHFNRTLGCKKDYPV